MRKSYRIAPDLALIETLDFFTPIVDDPYDFGQITAANALSDVYAMGGRPLLAMNIICFPVGGMDISVLEDVLRAGQTDGGGRCAARGRAQHWKTGR